jgi:hypothetical protein
MLFTTLQTSTETLHLPQSYKSSLTYCLPITTLQIFPHLLSASRKATNLHSLTVCLAKCNTLTINFDRSHPFVFCANILNLFRQWHALTKCTSTMVLAWWWLNEPKHVAEFLLLITNVCCVNDEINLLYYRKTQRDDSYQSPNFVLKIRQKLWLQDCL